VKLVVAYKRVFMRRMITSLRRITSIAPHLFTAPRFFALICRARDKKKINRNCEKWILVRAPILSRRDVTNMSSESRTTGQKDEIIMILITVLILLCTLVFLCLMQNDD